MEDFIMSVYRTLFQALKDILAPDSDLVPYTLTELSEKLPPYGGTSEKKNS